MAEVSTERAGLYALVAVEVPALFSVFCPSAFFTTRRFAEEEESSNDIRRGCLAATGMAVVLGVSVSLIDHTVWPFLIALLASALMWLCYEWSLRNPREDAVQMDTTNPGSAY